MWSRKMDLQNERNRLLTFRNWPIDFIRKEDLAEAGFYYLNISDKVKCIHCHAVVWKWERGDDPFEHSCCQEPQQTVRPPFYYLESRLRSFSGNNWRQSEIQYPQILSEAGFYYQEVEDEDECFYCEGGTRFWNENDDSFFEHARSFPTCPSVQLIERQQCNAYVLSQAEARENAANALRATTPIQSRIIWTPDSSPDFEESHPEPPQAAMSIDVAMRSEPVTIALQMGLNAGRVKMLTQRQLNLFRRPYTSTEALVEAVLDEQIQGEGYESTERNIENEVTRPSAAQLHRTNQTSSSNVSLEEENRRLKSARECKICMSNEVGVVFLPCGHISSCTSCSPSLQTCPLCRKNITQKVRTFLP